MPSTRGCDDVAAWRGYEPYFPPGRRIAPGRSPVDEWREHPVPGCTPLPTPGAVVIALHGTGGTAASSHRCVRRNSSAARDSPGRLRSAVAAFLDGVLGTR